jgi:hypothetical protein
VGLLLALFGLLALGLAIVLVSALWQNRGVMADLRRADRPPARLLRDALVVWSPLALLIVLLAFAANRLAAGAVALTYRLSTIDEYCEVPAVSPNTVIPCSGMDGVLDAGAVRRAGPQAELQVQVASRFERARHRILLASPSELSRRAAEPGGALLVDVSPRGVLGLERAPEDDPELARMKRELLALVAAPTPPPRDMLDTIRYVGERDARTARLRELTELVRQRRALVNEQAYAELSTPQQGLLWLRHRLAHLLEPKTSRPDPRLRAVLGRIAANPSASDGDVAEARRGLALLLARNEAASLSVLGRETGERRSAAALGLTLGLTPYCTVAADDPGLRRRAADFAEGEWAALDPSTWTQSNAGVFPCFDAKALVPPIRLDSLGFRNSVHHSIDRSFDEVAADAFRRLGRLSLDAGQAPAAAAASTRRLAAAMPGPMRLGRARCDWLHPGNCAGNAARSAAEAGLAGARRELADSAARAANEAGAGATASLDARIAAILVELDSRLEALRLDAHASAQRWFLLHDLLRALGWLTLALLAVKSFLFVLSLEAYHHGGELSVGFEDAPAVQGDYRVARRLSIDPSFPHALVTRQQLSNADNDLRLAPWPFSAPFSRLFHRRYLLFTRSRFLADAPAAEGGARGMVASAGGGMSIVEWRLAPGEEVVFGYRDFFGGSENLKLSTQISLRLSTLLLGRVFFRIASAPDGEARLLLKANVEENELEDLRALPPERMIAWNRHARFAVHSARTPWKTLLNGYTLVRRDPPGRAPGRIVVSSEEAGSNLGTIRFVRRMISALF